LKRWSVGTWATAGLRARMSFHPFLPLMEIGSNLPEMGEKKPRKLESDAFRLEVRAETRGAVKAFPLREGKFQNRGQINRLSVRSQAVHPICLK